MQFFSGGEEQSDISRKSELELSISEEIAFKSIFWGIQTNYSCVLPVLLM